MSDPDSAISDSGLTVKEQEVMDALIFAFNEFSLIDKQHPDDK